MKRIGIITESEYNFRKYFNDNGHEDVNKTKIQRAQQRVIIPKRAKRKW